MAIGYPTRCRIMDVEGVEVYPGILGATPEDSKPYIGQKGVARQRKDGEIEITLDSGKTLLGFECWWEPIVSNQSANNKSLERSKPLN